jgi:hypothetical protein
VEFGRRVAMTPIRVVDATNDGDVTLAASVS